MSDYKDRFEKWQKEAREKFEQIDSQLGISEKIESGARAVIDTAQKSAEKIVSEAEKNEAAREAVRAAGETIKTAGEAARKVWEAGEPIREAAGEAGEKAAATAGEIIKNAGEIFEGASRTAEYSVRGFTDALGFGAGFTRSYNAARNSLRNFSSWALRNPLEAAAAGVSAAVGAGIGVVFTGISSHWFFNSALPAFSVKILAKRFDGYLKSQNEKIASGRLAEAEAARISFETDIARRIGAPLLAGFSFASGAVLLTNVINPKTITGFPLGWLIGGNSFLEGIWFFGNGVVCLKTSHDFFMIAVEDDQEINTMIREIKGLLPSAFSN